jgi:hypothetical protein
VEAEEAGADPEDYRDYLIKPSEYDASPEIDEASH